MDKMKTPPQPINDEALDHARGGIALLLPAVQKGQATATSQNNLKQFSIARFGDGSV